MMDRFSRRQTLAMATASLLAGSRLDALAPSGLSRKLARLERQAGGRLGACLIDGGNGSVRGWRMYERFAHCSSFKLSLAAMVLQGAEQGRWSLGETLRWTQQDLLEASPVTTPATSTGLTMQELARAALVTSDNTAANTLLRRTGGPAAMTAFWRAMGDRVSRLDRYEPELNRVPRGSPLDTGTPRAMARTVGRLVSGNVLKVKGRDLLVNWMIAVETGKRRLRAGFPADWIAGDKTGTGYNPVSTTYVDLAFARPPGRAPLFIAAYFEPSQRLDRVDPAAEAVLARVGELCAEASRTRA